MLSIRNRFLLAACALAFGAVVPASAAEGETTEKLLKEAKFDYKVVKPGVYRVLFESKEGGSVIVVREINWGKDNKGEDILSISAFAQCHSTPADYKPSNALLTWIAEINERLVFGSLSISKDKDGTTYYFRNSSAMLKGLGLEEFVTVVTICHYSKFQLAKQLKAMTDDSK